MIPPLAFSYKMRHRRMLENSVKCGLRLFLLSFMFGVKRQLFLALLTEWQMKLQERQALLSVYVFRAKF